MRTRKKSWKASAAGIVQCVQVFTEIVLSNDEFETKDFSAFISIIFIDRNDQIS